MNEKDKAVLDAARKYASLLHAGNATSGDVRRATIEIQDAALDAFPADAGSQPETVRDVADLRDGEKVHVGSERRCRTRRVEEWARPIVVGPGGLIFDVDQTRFLVAAGAVTRPPRPEPDPADVERLEVLARQFDLEPDLDCKGLALHLLRSGEVTLRNPS